MADDPYAAANISSAPSDDPYAAANTAVAATAPAPPSIGFGNGGFGGVTKAASNAAKGGLGALVSGHKDPVKKMLDTVQGGQRVLQTAATQLLGPMFSPDHDDGLDIDPLKAFADPAMAPSLQFRSDRAMGIDPNGGVTQFLGGEQGNPVQKFGQGVVHSIADAVTNPISYVNPVKVASTVADVIPGAKPLLAAGGKAIAQSPLGQSVSALFNGDHYIRGLTPDGKALYESITNPAMEAVRSQKTAEDAVVKAHADEIRKGIMPPEVAKLFTADKGQAADTAWQKYFPKGLAVGTNPADVQAALFSNRAPVFQKLAMPALTDAGFFQSPSSIAAGRSMGKTDMFDLPTEGMASDPTHPINELQTRLAENLNPKALPSNPVAKLFAQGTQLGNQAFLANPVPHVGNLASLLYNGYGPGALAKGLVNAPRVAAGVGLDAAPETLPGMLKWPAQAYNATVLPARKAVNDAIGVKGNLADTIAGLNDKGTNSQYGNIFNELGFTGLKNAPTDNPLIPPALANAYNATLAPASRVVAKAVNVPLVAAQRASNAAQNAILNPAETAFRAAALDSERAAGTSENQAAKNIHENFGTGAPNGVVQFLQKASVPFAGFHYQTAPGSVARTALNNPGRIVDAAQTEQDMNKALGTKYRSTVPTLSAARMFTDSPNYFGNAGGVLGAQGPYSTLTQIKGGKGDKALANLVQKFTPGSEPGIDAATVAKSAVNQMLFNGPQTNYAPLFNAAFGGYTAK